MDASFKSFLRYTVGSYLEAQKKAIRDLPILAGDIIEPLYSSHSSQHVSISSPGSKRLQDDLFADFRNKNGARDPLHSD